MSQEYLNRLLSTPENRVQEECVICREPYGTLNTETGIIEAEIRLSCGHTVGSACIVTWLRDNNTCPHCRKEFFPRQPRPYLEHGIMDIGSQSTGRINATPSLTREPNVTRSRIAPAFAVPEPPAESRTSIFNAGGQGRDRLPTGPEVPRSPFFTSPPFRYSGLGESSTVRVPTGSEASTDSFIRGSRDSDPRNLSSESEAFEDLCARLLQDLNRASQGFDRLSVSSRSETSTN